MNCSKNILTEGGAPFETSPWIRDSRLHNSKAVRPYVWWIGNEVSASLLHHTKLEYTRDFWLPMHSRLQWKSYQVPVFFKDNDVDCTLVCRSPPPSALPPVSDWTTTLYGSQIPGTNAEIISTSFNRLCSSNTWFPAEYEPMMNQLWTNQQCILASKRKLISDIRELQALVSFSCSSHNWILGISTTS